MDPYFHYKLPSRGRKFEIRSMATFPFEARAHYEVAFVICITFNIQKTRKPLIGFERVLGFIGQKNTCKKCPLETNQIVPYMLSYGRYYW